MLEYLQTRLEARRAAGLYRTRRITPSLIPPGSLSFENNNYLGLRNHPQIIATMMEVAHEQGLSSSASHLLGGHHYWHDRLEKNLSKWLGFEQTLVFSSGYMANLGVLQALLHPNDWVFHDRLNHASLIDGVKLSRANHKRYRHLDTDHLAQLLVPKRDKVSTLIVTDGVFSMDGDIAPLSTIMKKAHDSQAFVMVDDAHGIGVLGKNGQGICEHTSTRPDILIGTFGKAFGTSGAFVASRSIIIESLIQFARPYIYTTALSPALAAATLTSLNLIQKQLDRRVRLNQLIQYFTQHTKQCGFDFLPSSTPIQALIAPLALVTHLHQYLKNNNIQTGLIRPPTVACGQSRLRFNLVFDHSQEDIDRLFDLLNRFFYE